MFSRKMARISQITFCFILLPSSFVWAQDWTQWRGPGRSGVAADFQQPEAWPDSLRTIWSVEAGSGLSSPLVKDGRIYLLARVGDDETVSSYDLSTGKRFWQDKYPAPFIPNSQATSPRFFPQSQGKGPFATPILHEGFLYTMGIDRVLSCWEVKTGALKWRRQFQKQEVPENLVYICQPCGCPDDGKDFDAPGACPSCRMPLGVKGMETTASQGQGNYYGTAASPVISGSLGVVNVGNLEGGQVIAFDLKSGKEKWRWQGPPPSSSSPVVANFQGKDQIVVLTRTNLAGIDARNGEELWTFAIESNAQIVTPIIFEDTVIFSAYRSPTTAIQISKSGDSWSVEQIWSTNDVTLYTSTPVLVGDKLFGLSYTNRGQYFCLDVRSGERLWASEGRQAAGAAILNLGDAFAALTDQAKLALFAKDASAFKPIANYTVADSPTWAHPVFIGKNVLIKDESKLTLLSFE